MKRNSERGAALVIAIVFMAIFGLLGTAYWQHLNFTLAHARYHAKDQAAHALAESGIERALAEFRAGNAAFTAAGPESLGQGTYRVTITPEPGGSRLVTATGTLSEHHTCEVRARLHLSPAGQVAAIEYLPEVK